MPKTLWHQAKGTLDNVEIGRFSDSLPVDRRLAEEDINGSIAYAEALNGAGILSGREMQTIKRGLLRVRKLFAVKNATTESGAEDIHTAVELALTRLAGKSAGKIHTGRSRNEQVVLDERLYLKREIPAIQDRVKSIQKTILGSARKYTDVLMPGYTHMQQAQPVSFSFYLMSWFHMLERDKQRFEDCAKRLDVCPSGSGALSGNSYGIDRHKLSGKLGFGSPSENALDAVSDRDFIVECLSCCAILMMHLSRFCEDLAVWSSSEFGFVQIAGGLATSSSLMPQKRNPDALELIRGKTGRVYGNLFNLLTVMKGLPLGYNKDMQEDKLPMFDSVDTVSECLTIFTLAVDTIKIFPDRMRQSLNSSVLSTDLADYLVKKGVPFRKSHTAVSKLALYAAGRQCPIDKLTLTEFRRYSPEFGKDVYKVFDFKRSVELKQTYGGTSTPAVRKQIAEAERILAEK